MMPLKKLINKKSFFLSRIKKNPYSGRLKGFLNDTFIQRKQIAPTHLQKKYRRKGFYFRYSQFIVDLNIKERAPYAILCMRRHNNCLGKLFYY